MNPNTRIDIAGADPANRTDIIATSDAALPIEQWPVLVSLPPGTITADTFIGPSTRVSVVAVSPQGFKSEPADIQTTPGAPAKLSFTLSFILTVQVP